MDDRASDEIARNRWLAINAMRIGGVAVVVAALLMIRGVIAAPEWAGYALLGLGLIDVFLVPQMMARKWRSPRE